MKLESVLRWETMLGLVLIAEFAFFAAVSPYFLDVWTLSDATFNFTERAVIALPLALLIIAGEIDISVAAIIALSSVAMGLAAAAGIVGGNAARELEVISDVSEGQKQAMRDFLAAVPISVNAIDNGILFDIHITLYVDTIDWHIQG